MDFVVLQVHRSYGRSPLKYCFDVVDGQGSHLYTDVSFGTADMRRHNEVIQRKKL